MGVGSLETQFQGASMFVFKIFVLVFDASVPE